MTRKKHLTMCGLRPRAAALMVSRDPFIIRLTWPCGYHRDISVEKDKTWRRIAPALLVKWTTGERGYWTKGGGGISDECPRCRREILKAQRRAEQDHNVAELRAAFPALTQRRKQP